MKLEGPTMKKVLLNLLFAGVTLFATTGEDVYKTNCASCHAMQGMMSKAEKSAMREKMQNATQEEKQAMKKSMMEKMKKSDMKAPPMPMVSMRLKRMMDNDRAKFIVFVDDYIQNPSQKKGYCMPMAYKRFGTMPPIGKGMTKEDRTLVSTWLFDNFKASWGKSMDGKMCDMKNQGMKKGKGKGMKCGGGKCGEGKSSKSQMKCGAGKCGK